MAKTWRPLPAVWIPFPANQRVRGPRPPKLEVESRNPKKKKFHENAQRSGAFGELG
jgi:hypothetical protein